MKGQMFVQFVIFDP